MNLSKNDQDLGVEVKAILEHLTKEKENEAIETAINSLEVRNDLWNFILKEIKKERTPNLFHLQASKYSDHYTNA